MQFEKISDTADVLWFEFTCPFCSRSYSINKTWERVDGGSECIYDYLDDSDRCHHLIMWDNATGGCEYNYEIFEQEWITRMSDLPFRIWDVLQEIVNNNDMPDGCETGIRSFYVHSYIAFIFTNDPATLARVVRERTEQYIREYNARYSLAEDDRQRYSEILVQK